MNSHLDTKLGLVLSGGGAKGAYQAGLLRYMAEQNIQPAMVSGTSIGALNAAVISAQKDISKASDVINTIWQELSKKNPIEVKKAPLFLSSVAILLSFSTILSRTIVGVAIDKAIDKTGLVREQPLNNILGDNAPVKLLKAGLPLYVSLYESEGSGTDLVKYFSTTLLNSLSKDTKDSEFKHIQSLSSDIMHEAIMASAALPYFFKAHEIEGKKYRDGGMGGSINEQGNTPAQPLAEAGCTHLIISMLDDGSMFDRHNPIYNDVAIIEVRPQEFISTSKLDMFAFTPEKIPLWMVQGYKDAKRCIGNSLNALSVIKENENTKSKVVSVLQDLHNDDFHIGD
jgi:NTE family protein